MSEKIKIKRGESKVFDIPPPGVCVDIEMEDMDEIVKLCNENGKIRVFKELPVKRHEITTFQI